jgi:type IV secretion system protein VirB8
MTDMSDERLDEYYREAETWAEDRDRARLRSVRIAWIVAGIAALVAVLEAAALFVLVPLRRDVPYTLLVDRQTGYVQALRPLDTETVSADTALTRSFLVQYVIARESFDAASVQENYRRVGLWSTGEARERYVAGMSATNPGSPLAALPRGTSVDVTVRSVSSLSADTALVRFSTTQTDPGAQPQAAQHWASVITWRFSNADMTAEDRLTNPLGFQVIRYRRDAETLPEAAAPAQAFPEAPPIRSTMSGPGARERAP